MPLYRVYAIVMIKWSIRTVEDYVRRTIYLGEYELEPTSIDKVESCIFMWCYLALAKAKSKWKTTMESKVTLSILGEKYGRRAIVHVDLVDKKFKLRVYEKEGAFRNYLRFRRGKRQKRIVIEKAYDIIGTDNYNVPTTDIVSYISEFIKFKPKPTVSVKKIKREFKPLFSNNFNIDG